MASGRRFVGQRPRLVGAVPTSYDPLYFQAQFQRIQRMLEKVWDSEADGIPAGFSDSDPSPIQAGDAADPGDQTSGRSAGPHVHEVLTGAAVDIDVGFTSGEGSGAALARAEHIHANPYVSMWRFGNEFTFSDFSAASPSNTIELFSLPDCGVIDLIEIDHDEAFGGGGLTGYTVEVGITGDLTKYAPPIDVFSAPNTIPNLVVCFGSESVISTAISVKITARATGGNLSAATAGHVWVNCRWGVYAL